MFLAGASTDYHATRNGKPSCGAQNRPPQEVPLEHVIYFELKTIETLWAHEKILPLP